MATYIIRSFDVLVYSVGIFLLISGYVLSDPSQNLSLDNTCLVFTTHVYTELILLNSVTVKILTPRQRRPILRIIVPLKTKTLTY